MFPEEADAFTEVGEYIYLYNDLNALNKLGIKTDQKELTPQEIESLLVIEGAVNRKATSNGQ